MMFSEKKCPLNKPRCEGCEWFMTFIQHTEGKPESVTQCAIRWNAQLGAETVDLLQILIARMDANSAAQKESSDTNKGFQSVMSTAMLRFADAVKTIDASRGPQLEDKSNGSKRPIS